MGRKTLSLIATYIIISALLTGCAYSKNPEHKTIITSLYDEDTLMWNHIFSQKPQTPFEQTPGGIILPHHMIVAEEVSKAYQKLAMTIQPSIIVIISPNHYQNATANIQTCTSCEYKTIDGETSLNTKLTNKLIKDHMASDEPTTFVKEHGIFNHAPFIHHFFPKATILPIALKWETPPEETIRLSEWLNANIPTDALVIASVDFSHYIPVEHADFHDITSYATIKNFDYTNIYDLEIDSPPTISTVEHLMEKRGYMQTERFAHTNNQQFRNTKLAETTSHQFISFTKGEKQPEKSITIMSVGEVPEEAKVNDDGSRLSFYDSYRWNINWENDTTKSDSTKLNTFLRDIRGKEDRLLVGSNFLIFDLEIPINSCLRRTQNDMNISFCRLSPNQKTLTQDWNSLLQKEKTTYKSDKIYISLEADTMTTSGWKPYARILVDQGANIVIGKTQKQSAQKPTPIDYYHNGLIIQSLGDFITSESKTQSSGNIVEITITPSSIDAKLYPIEIKKGYPKLKGI